MVGVLEVRTSVLPASRNTSKGLDRYNCCHNISEVDTACPELAGDVQYRSILLRCLALHINPHCLTGREPMPHRAFERCIDEFRKQMREPQNPQYDYDIVNGDVVYKPDYPTAQFLERFTSQVFGTHQRTCRRFSGQLSGTKFKEYFDCVSDEPDCAPRFNIAPTQPILVIRQHPKEPVRKLSLMRWGLIPSWAGDSSAAARIINARSETAGGLNTSSGTCVNCLTRTVSRFRRSTSTVVGKLRSRKQSVRCMKASMPSIRQRFWTLRGAVGRTSLFGS